MCYLSISLVSWHIPSFRQRKTTVSGSFPVLQGQSPVVSLVQVLIVTAWWWAITAWTIATVVTWTVAIATVIARTWAIVTAVSWRRTSVTMVTWTTIIAAWRTVISHCGAGYRKCQQAH
jgi:hypothetical protein